MELLMSVLVLALVLVPAFNTQVDIDILRCCGVMRGLDCAGFGRAGCVCYQLDPHVTDKPKFSCQEF